MLIIVPRAAWPTAGLSPRLPSSALASASFPSATFNPTASRRTPARLLQVREAAGDWLSFTKLFAHSRVRARPPHAPRSPRCDADFQNGSETHRLLSGGRDSRRERRARPSHFWTGDRQPARCARHIILCVTGIARGWRDVHRRGGEPRRRRRRYAENAGAAA